MKGALLRRGLSLFGLFLLLSIPIIFYVIKFRSFEISDNPRDWESFAVYFGGTVGTMGSMIAGYFLYRTFILQIETVSSDKLNQRVDYYNRAIESVKHDLTSIEMGAIKGSYVWRRLASIMTNEENFNNGKASLEPCMELLVTANYQIATLMMEINADSIIDGQEKQFLHQKVIALFSAYIGSVTGAVTNDVTKTFKDKQFINLRQSSITVAKVMKLHLDLKVDLEW